jgi:hypothetical protein
MPFIEVIVTRPPSYFGSQGIVRKFFKSDFLCNRHTSKQKAAQTGLYQDRNSGQAAEVCFRSMGLASSLVGVLEAAGGQAWTMPGETVWLKTVVRL